MYQDFFGLNAKPFGIVPDTRFLFLSDSHREAIAHLVYALNEKNGFVQLTGEVGVGKTMACRYLLAHIPDDIDVALILNPRIDDTGLLRTLCQELQIPFQPDKQANELTQLIYERLLASHSQDRHTILIIDEAQNLPQQTLEQVRLLTNLETDTQKLLRIILIGQPELGELLSRHDTRQVAQRITSRYHLSTLEPSETEDYIRHRLKVAGTTEKIFSYTAMRKVHKLTDGTPRLINLLCDNALMAAYSKNTHVVTPKLIKAAAKEALPFVQATPFSTGLRWIPWLGLLALLILGIMINPTWSKWIEAQWKNFTDTTTISSTESQPTRPEPKLVEMVKASPKNNAPITSNDYIEQFKTDRNKRNPPPTREEVEFLKNQADVEFRLGIPSKPVN